VRDAVGVHMELRNALGTLEPFWPIGLPGWDDSAICLGLRGPGECYLILWDRSDEAASITVPGVRGAVREVFPLSLSPWRTASEGHGIRFETVPGLTARVFELLGD
jgi:alpha-galactosidase